MTIDSFLSSPGVPRRLASLNQSLDRPTYPYHHAEFKRPVYESPGTPRSNSVLDDLDAEISHELEQFRHSGNKWQYGITDYRSKAARYGLVMETAPGPAVLTASHDLSASTRGTLLPAVKTSPVALSRSHLNNVPPRRDNLSPLSPVVRESSFPRENSSPFARSPLSPVSVGRSPRIQSPLRHAAAASTPSTMSRRNNPQYHVLLLTNYYEALNPDIHRRSFKNVEEHFDALFHSDVRIYSAKRIYSKGEWRAIITDMVSNNIHARDFIIRKYEADYVLYCLTLVVGNNISYPRSRATFLNGQCIRIEPAPPCEGQNYDEHKRTVQRMFSAIQPSQQTNRVARFLSTLDDLLHDGFTAHVEGGTRNKAEWRALWEDLTMAGVVAEEETIHYSEGHVCGYSASLTVNGVTVVVHDKLTFREDQVIRLDAVQPSAMQQLVVASLTAGKPARSARGPAGARPIRLAGRPLPGDETPVRQTIAPPTTSFRKTECVETSPVQYSSGPSQFVPRKSSFSTESADDRLALRSTPFSNISEALFKASPGKGLLALKESRSVVTKELPPGSGKSFLGGSRKYQTIAIRNAPAVAKAAPQAPVVRQPGDGLKSLMASSPNSRFSNLLKQPSPSTFQGTTARPPISVSAEEVLPLLLRAADNVGSSTSGLLRLQAASKLESKSAPNRAQGLHHGGNGEYSALKALININGNATSKPKHLTALGSAIGIGNGDYQALQALIDITGMAASKPKHLTALGSTVGIGPKSYAPLATALVAANGNSQFTALGTLTQAVLNQAAKGSFFALGALVNAAPQARMLGYLSKLARVAGIPQDPNAEYCGLVTALKSAASDHMGVPSLQGLASTVSIHTAPVKGESTLAGLDSLMAVCKQDVLLLPHLHRLGQTVGNAPVLSPGAIQGKAMTTLLVAAGGGQGLQNLQGLNLLTTVMVKGQSARSKGSQVTDLKPGAIGVPLHITSLGYLKLQGPTKNTSSRTLIIAPHVTAAGYLPLQGAAKNTSPKKPVIASHVTSAGYLSWLDGKPHSTLLDRPKGAVNISRHVLAKGYLKL